MISKATLKTIDPIVRTLSGDRLYTSYQLSKREYIGDVEYAAPGIIWYLPEKAGYEDPPSKFGVGLEAAKTHPESGEIHDYSFRRVCPDNPRKQYHVHLWGPIGEDPQEAHYEVFSHREYRPDLKRVGDESLSDMIDRLKVHYSPDWSTDEYELGVIDPALEGVVNE